MRTGHRLLQSLQSLVPVQSSAVCERLCKANGGGSWQPPGCSLSNHDTWDGSEGKGTLLRGAPHQVPLFAFPSATEADQREADGDSPVHAMPCYAMPFCHTRNRPLLRLLPAAPERSTSKASAARCARRVSHWSQPRRRETRSAGDRVSPDRRAEEVDLQMPSQLLSLCLAVSHPPMPPSPGQFGEVGNTTGVVNGRLLAVADLGRLGNATLSVHSGSEICSGRFRWFILNLNVEIVLASWNLREPLSSLFTSHRSSRYGKRHHSRPQPSGPFSHTAPVVVDRRGITHRKRIT